MKLISSENRYGQQLADCAAFFRTIAFEIDANPNAILNYKDDDRISKLILSDKMSGLEKVTTYEALAYGDAGVLLACPGPSLAGHIIDELGNPEQKNIFYHHVTAHNAQTFLAVTEPACGSSLSRLSLTLQRNNILVGEKWLVGHGATGSIGVAIARMAPGPLGIIPVLLTPDVLKSQQLQRMELSMLGLKGARLGRLIFKEVKIPEENKLGLHHRAVQRGMMALIKTFNQMRPCIGALAVGLAQAVLDYVYENTKRLTPSEKKLLEKLSLSVNLSRLLIQRAAQHAEKNPFDSAISSLAKVKSTRIAEEVTEAAISIFKTGALIKHPWLAKWRRDVLGFEYMEGTQNMQLLNVCQGIS